MTINPSVFCKYTKHHPELRTFLETGTFQGSTALEASMYFVDVKTVELLPQYYDASKARLGSLGIECFCGDSANFLQTVLPRVVGPAFIYLDAHYSGFGPEPASDYVLPLWRELQVLWEFAVSDHPHHRSGDVIAIDDIRLCGSDYAGWKETTLHKLVEALLSINSDYSLCLESGIVAGDVLVAHLP